MVKATPYLFFPLAVAFTTTHYIALQAELYWYISQLDTVMHLWGGFLVVCGVLMLRTVGSGRLRSGGVGVALVLVGVMLAWEVFEYSLGLTRGQPDFVSDTILDLVCGSLGGLLAYWLLQK